MTTPETKRFFVVAAILVPVIAGFVAFFWSENYGNPFTHEERRQEEESRSATVQARIIAMQNPTPAPPELPQGDSYRVNKTWRELKNRGTERWERCKERLERYIMQKRANPTCAHYHTIRGKAEGGTIDARDWMREVFSFCQKYWFYRTRTERSRADRFLETSLCDASDTSLLHKIFYSYGVNRFTAEFIRYRDWWESERWAK